MGYPFAKYGTLEYYKEYFSDIISDANGDPQTAQLLLEAFEAAINDWLIWHQECGYNYDQLHTMFLSNRSKVNINE